MALTCRVEEPSTASLADIGPYLFDHLVGEGEYLGRDLHAGPCSRQRAARPFEASFTAITKRGSARRERRLRETRLEWLDGIECDLLGEGSKLLALFGQLLQLFACMVR